jgi:hypothetical protein
MKRTVLIGAFALLATTASLVALASANDCKHECQGQFQEDKRQCRERDASDAADSSRQLDECLLAADGRADELRCEADAIRGEHRRSREKQRCDREAKQRRDACRAGCQQSPVAP